MLHPVGSLPPQIYWRRRIMLAGAVAAVALLVLTTLVLTSNGNGETTAGAGASTTSSSGRTGSSSSTTPSASTTPSGTGNPTSSAATTPASSGPAGSSTAVAACAGAQLTVSAVSSAPSYKVGDQPVLTLQVANNGPGNCTQDLADSQVELRVYNGAARVWGSHDCLIQPGTDVKTLATNTTVGVQITWSGLSSQPACAGTRQRVGAGTYTLYPYLAGAQGTAAQFSIT